MDDARKRRVTDWKDSRTLWKDRNPQFVAFGQSSPWSKAPLAQSVEHQTFNLRAAGSNPAGSIF